MKEEPNIKIENDTIPVKTEEVAAALVKLEQEPCDALTNADLIKEEPLFNNDEAHIR